MWRFLLHYWEAVMNVKAKENIGTIGIGDLSWDFPVHQGLNEWSQDKMKTLTQFIAILAISLLASLSPLRAAEPNNGAKSVELSDQQIKEIVQRSYQYVAMYNVNQKMALAELGVTTKGYNKGMRKTELLDHTVEFIARPNNDVLYQLAMLDLRKDAIVLKSRFRKS
jgi:hypothetical protein